ncbi:Organic cation/carnitine transporter 7 [Datura stramonium]|uniref:Organic cation/carnitine transporter 7 n=1 Tax=Datura stramonium TaxID=4076 RepID=A0ABS8SIV3_DATST|nr:Organic cation/carnitine transporter 7 [Datura stramonium]
MNDESGTYTVDEALVALGFGNFQVLVLIYAGMGWISEAMEMMLLSFVGPAVQSAWGLSTREESLLTSVVFAGMLIGAYLWGSISDKCGRRKHMSEKEVKGAKTQTDHFAVAGLIFL